MSFGKSIAFSALILSCSVIYTNTNDATATGIDGDLAVRKACLNLLSDGRGLYVPPKEQLDYCFGDLRYPGLK